MDAEIRRREVEKHLAAIRSLEAETVPASASRGWPPSGFYLLWHIGVGAILGAVGATVSLLANVLMAPLFGRRPLELIRVYLTFPMGERALEIDAGVVLFVGCVLYLVTGALFGILIHFILTIFFDQASRRHRFLVATGIGVGLWVVNFYLILSWLQPMLLGDNWIVRLVPPWVGCLTHLSFAWAVVVSEGWGWGRFEPYQSGAPKTIGGALGE